MRWRWVGLADAASSRPTAPRDAPCCGVRRSAWPRMSHREDCGARGSPCGCNGCAGSRTEPRRRCPLRGAAAGQVTLRAGSRPMRWSTQARASGNAAALLAARTGGWGSVANGQWSGDEAHVDGCAHSGMTTPNRTFLGPMTRQLSGPTCLGQRSTRPRGRALRSQASRRRRDDARSARRGAPCVRAGHAAVPRAVRRVRVGVTTLAWSGAARGAFEQATPPCRAKSGESALA